MPDADAAERSPHSPTGHETVIPVGRGAEGFDVSPDGTEIWAANAQDGTISILDFTAKKVTQTLNANVQRANRLKFTPDGKLVFVSTLSGPDLIIFDAATRKESSASKSAPEPPASRCAPTTPSST